MPNNQDSENRDQIDYGSRARIQLEQAVLDGHPDSAAKTRAWLSNPDTPAEMRALAASLMASLPQPEVERTLIETVVRKSSDLVLIHVCRALAFIGTEECLKPIERLAKTSEGPLLESAQFAHILVSHRLLKPSSFFKPANVQERLLIDGPGGAFISHSLTPEQLGEAYKGLVQYPSIGSSHPEAGIKIACRSQQWIVMFQDNVMRKGISETLSRTPAVLGGVLLWSAEHRTWSLSRVVLGGPIGRDQFYVASFRKNGVLDLFGSGSSEESLIQLRAVDRPGALPMLVSVYWNGKFVSVTGVSGFQRTKKNLVRKIAPPGLRSPDFASPNESKSI
jgi:hypothetical protein